jgi:hypothetical protein
MTLPANLAVATVTGTLRDQAEQPLKTITMVFQPSIDMLRDPTSGDIFLDGTPYPTCVTDDTDGTFSIDLLPCNDPDSTPINWWYIVTLTGTDNGGQQLSKTFKAIVIHDEADLKLAAIIDDGPDDGPIAVVSLGMLSDVDISTSLPTDGQSLTYHAATKKWIPATITGGGGDDLSDYYTKEEVAALLGDYVTSDTLETYALISDVSTALATKLSVDDAADTYATATAQAADATNISDLQGRVSSLETGGSTGGAGVVLLDGFDGASDDDKLGAAMTYAAAQTYHPTIQLLNRAYSFTVARTLYDGFRMQGPPGYSNAEKSAPNMACKVDVNVAGGIWLNATSGSFTWDLYLAHLCFTGHSTVQFLATTNGGLYCALLRDLTFANFKSVMGSQAAKCQMTACVFDGFWDVDNSYAGAFHIAGSDNNLWPSGMLLDSGTAFNSGAVGQYHLWCDFLENTTIGPIFITCEGNWSGIKVSGPAYNSGGSNLGGLLVFSPGLRVQGRNIGQPCNGAVMRIEGGIVSLRDASPAFGMASPSSNTHSPVDAGIIHQTAGMLIADGIMYDHATGVAETVPLLYSAGGIAIISRALLGSKGGAWTGKPGTKASGGTITNDSTMTTL